MGRWLEVWPGRREDICVHGGVGGRRMNGEGSAWMGERMGGIVI